MIKKKGRKPKSYYTDLNNNISDTSNNTNIMSNNETLNNDISCEPDKKIPKKRGRKPKGGKLVTNIDIKTDYIVKKNIILHLKCSYNDIYNNDITKYNPNIEKIESYNINNNNTLSFNYIKKENTYDNNMYIDNYVIYNDNNKDKDKNLKIKENRFQNSDNNNNNDNNDDNDDNDNDNDNDIDDDNINYDDNIESYNRSEKNLKHIKNSQLEKKIIFKKLQELNNKFKYNNINKNSHCFWCTYSFSNDKIVIPMNISEKCIKCYGCFCTPECACSYLMNENIDSTIKFERYYLLNNIYGKIFNYDYSIKQAPSPYYTLEKYFGNLTIEEYRNLKNYDKNIQVINKPLSQITPEIYEENNDYIINNKIINKNNISKKN